MTTRPTIGTAEPLSDGLNVSPKNVPADKFVRVPLATLANPQKRGPLMVYQDHWWATDDAGNAFFFQGRSYSPQCNTNRLIVERHLASGLAARAVFLPWAYVQFSISDYD